MPSQLSFTPSYVSSALRTESQPQPPAASVDNYCFPDIVTVLSIECFSKSCSEYSRLLLVALILYSAQAARDEVLAYTQERKQFGKPLVDFQAVQLRLAEMEMKTTAARLLIHAAASRAVSITADHF